MQTSIPRTIAVLNVGFACLTGAHLLLDAPLTREVIAWFLLVPVGAILVVFAIWTLLSAFLRD